MSAGLMTVDARTDYMPALTPDQSRQRYNQLLTFVGEQMQKDKDYGAIPGTEKNTLFKPGAEKLLTFFGFSIEKPVFVEKIEDWTGADHGGEPLFYYLVEQTVTRHGYSATQCGSANSWESKHRYRWVPEQDLPPGADKAKLRCRSGAASEFVFAVDKAETGGQYGKPAEYWQKFKDAIANGTARHIQKTTSKGKTYPAIEIGSTLYRIPNDDTASLINSILKMAQKRALVAVALVACNASEFFTQDVEDMAPLETEGHAEPARKPEASTRADPTPAPGWARREPTPSSATAPPASPVEHPLDHPKPTTVKGLPVNGRELAEWLGAMDDAGADNHDWRRGELMTYIVECGRQEKLPEDMHAWPDSIIRTAVELAQKWEGEHGKPSGEQCKVLRELLVHLGKEEQTALDWLASELALEQIPLRLEELNLNQFGVLSKAIAPKKKNGKKAG